jgi:hypothetical protein
VLGATKRRLLLRAGRSSNGEIWRGRWQKAGWWWWWREALRAVLMSVVKSWWWMSDE